MTAPDPGARSRRPLVALLAADAVSLTGNVAALVAIPWFVLQTTGSATKTGITASAALAPIVLSGLFGGALVDRLGHRRASVIADLASAGAVAAIPLLYATVGLEFWQLLVLVFLGGLLDVPGDTARGALLPGAAARAGWRLERATGARSVVERGSRLMGAPLAGVLLAVTDPTNVLWIDAASFLVSAAIVAFGVPRPAAVAPAERTTYMRELGEGYTFLRRDRTLRDLVLVVSMTNALDAITIVAIPVLAAQVYGGAVSLGLLLGASAVGAVLGALAFAAIGQRLSRRAVFTWGFVVVTFWYPVAALIPPIGFLLAAKVVSGVGSGPLNPVIDTVFLERVPERLRGRVFGVTRAATWLAMPIGVVVGGAVIDAVGVRPTILATGLVYLAVTLGLRLSPGMRGLDAHPERVPTAA